MFNIALCCAVSLVGCSTTDDPGTELRERIVGRDPSTQFTMEYRATGTEVLDCFLPNREFIIEVRGDTLVARRTDEPPAVVAQRTGAELQLAPTLFEPGLLRQRWLAIDLAQLTAPDRSTLSELLGADLASYLLTDALPSNGQEIAIAALDAATAVDTLGVETIGTQVADRFRITLDPESYADAQPTTSSTASGPDAGTPVVDVWVGADDDVVRVGVSSGESRGWVIDFDDVDPANGLERTTTLPLAAIELGSLSAAAVDCEV